MGRFSEQVAAADDIGKEIVVVPEWGDLTIEVRSVSLGLRNRIAQSASKGERTDTAQFQANIVIASSYDPETGERAFDPDDLKMLQGKNPGALDRISKVAMRLSGMDDADAQTVLDAAGKDSSSTGIFDSDS